MSWRDGVYIDKCTDSGMQLCSRGVGLVLINKVILLHADNLSTHYCY